MSTNLEKLTVQFSAEIRSYTNQLAKMAGITRAELKKIEAEASRAGAVTDAAFAGAAGGVTRFGSAASRASTQMRGLQGQTGNLAAQINDIGVQLAGGQSPFLIALQQGTQINQVLGGQGARGAVAALAGAFTSLLNPVSLATIAIIAAGGTAVQYFSGLLGDAEKSAEELKKQSDLIRQVAKDWGDAVPAIKAYADEIERAAREAQLLEATQGRVEQIAADFRQQFEGLGAGLAQALDALDVNDLKVTTEIFALQDAFQGLEEKVKDGSQSSEDFERVQRALATLIQSTGNPALQSFAGNLAAVSSAAATASDRMAQLTSETARAVSQLQTLHAAEAASMAGLAQAEGRGGSFIAEQERLNALTGEQLRLENEIARTRESIARDGGIATPEEVEGLARATLAAEDRRAAEARAAAAGSRSSGGGGRGAAASEADREREAVEKLIEALLFEQSLVGLTALEKEKANALRRAGVAATVEERAQIEEIVAATYGATEALRQSEEQMERLKGLSRDVLQGMADDLIDGASAADVLANALTRVGASFLQSGIDALVEGVFAGRAGPIGGGILGGRVIPGILHKGGEAGVDGYGHGRSVPAGVFAGARRYHSGGVVGLNPGEVPAILQRGERVIPRGGSAAQRVEVGVAVSVDDDGRIRAYVQREGQASVARAVRTSVRTVQEGVAASRRFLRTR